MVCWPFFWESVISTEVSSAERTRFRNLLELAHSSEFEGERANALDAARRIAERHGLTLEEAARFGLKPAAVAETHRQTNGRRDPRGMYFAFAQQEIVTREKRHWEDAVRRARERGLDGETPEPRPDMRPRRTSRTRRDPAKHAAVLLEETRLPFHEIAEITGLSIYAVVGMKLKMRGAV